MTRLLQIIGADTKLRKVASTRGGEYHGPCPFCGGTDRFVVQPEVGETGWWGCPRHCGRSGDGYDYIQARDNVSFPEARRRWHGAGIQTRRSQMQPAQGVDSKNAQQRKAYDTGKWQQTVGKYIKRARVAADNKQAFWDWLKGRGIDSDIAIQAELGMSPQEFIVGGMKFYRGLVIPLIGDSFVHYIGCKVRTGKGKYIHIKGSDGGSLYGLHKLPRNPKNGLQWTGNDVILVESELDALMLESILAKCLRHYKDKDASMYVRLSCLTPLATGTATGGRKDYPTLDAHADRIIVALDDDANKAGDKGAAWWLERGGIRLMPMMPDRLVEKFVGGVPQVSDPGEIYEHGGARAVAEWLLPALKEWEFEI